MFDVATDYSSTPPYFTFLLPKKRLGVFHFYETKEGVDNKSHIKPKDVTRELILKDELAKRLKVCTRKVELMVNAGEIPVIKIGTAVRFNWEKVLAALETNQAA